LDKPLHARCLLKLFRGDLVDNPRSYTHEYISAENKGYYHPPVIH